ncbi:PilZ domain protein [compost metagenome]
MDYQDSVLEPYYMSVAFKESPKDSIRSDGRRAKRERSNVKVNIEFQGRSVPGKIHDLSTTGMQVVTERIFIPPQGANVTVKAREIGVIEGVVRWCRNDRIGIQFSGNSASVAQMKAYFRFFHKDLA